jgi:sialic acid synthase SpsE
VLLVAEIGLNHDGNFDLAYELIRQAKLAGADIAKFQFGWRCRPDEINHIDADRATQLKSWCDYIGIEMFASIITEDALELAHHINMSRYKIASRTVIENPGLCEKILAEGKPTYVSLGMWEKREFPFGDPDGDHLHYIYCRSKYPTSPEDLAGMPERFHPRGFYGYSDHLRGIEACLLAIARGARYIEKHFTLNKTSRVIRDHVLSATPDEFRQLTELGRPLAKLVEVVARLPA